MSVNSTMKRLGRAAEFLAWGLFFVCAALALALRYWLLPDIERYRGQIVAAVSHALGQPVRIGAIEAGWLGFNPRLQLSDVRIFDRDGREALVLGSVHNVLAWDGLVRGKLKLQSLVIEGPRLQVRRDASGVLYVAGARLDGNSGFSTWLLAQPEIVVRNAEIEWHDDKRGAPALSLSGVNLRLRNTGSGHSIGLTAQPPRALGSTLELRALLDGGSLVNPAALSGRVFAELGYTDLAAWRAWLDTPFEFQRGQGALRVWLTLQTGEVTQATADVALATLAVRLARELPPLELASVHGRLQGRAEAGTYRLSGRAVSLAVENAGAVTPSDFEASWTPGGEAQGAFAARAVDLAPLARLAAALPLSVEVRRTLAEMRPRGRLADASIEWSGLPDAPKRFTARAKFSDLAAQASGVIPGFAGLSGAVDASETKGRVVLATRKSVLELPRVFQEPRVALDSLDGELEWERRAARRLNVRVASLSFANEHLSGTAEGTYAFVGEGPGTVDLSAQFNRADAEHLARYLPHAALMGGARTRNWLVSSIRAGRSDDVKVRIRGDLREFPFTDRARGEFRVAARIENAVLDYAGGWPKIDDIDGELVFERASMEVNAQSARIGGVALAGVHARIGQLGNPDSLLEIRGAAEGPNADFLSFIAASPVRRMAAGITDPMNASGRGKLALRVDLPLKDPSKARVAGEFDFAADRVVVHPQLPPLADVVGKVGFTESTITMNDVRGRLFGGALQLAGGTRPDASLHILAKGEASAEGVIAFLHPAWQGYFSGAAPYVATVQVAQSRARLVFDSTLRGIESRLPAPLAKRGSEALPVRVEVLPADLERDRVQLVIGRILAAEVARRRQGEAMVLDRVTLALSPSASAPLRPTQRSGIYISGALPALDVGEWAAVFSGAAIPAEAAFDVRIGTLDAFGKRFHDAAVRGTTDAGGWSANVKAQELAGDVAYRGAGAGKLVARLTHFRVPEDAPGAEAAQPQPKDLPSMDFSAERFTYRGKELGRVELAAQRSADDWRVDSIALTNADAKLTGKGVWHGGSPARTSFDFELQTADAGQFLTRVGYRDVLKGGKAELKGSLAWNGEPALIDYASLVGEVQLRAQDGQFLEIEPGFGKLISLMSLQSLPRRIALDFRDVFSKGFAFERISSSGHVERGVMAVKDFRMRGSGAHVEMSGDVDLAAETQNLRVRVVPSLGDSAATVIGLVNPLFAIPAAIAQKILKDPLGHIFAYDYAVSGGWVDPKVVKLGVEAREAPPGP